MFKLTAIVSLMLVGSTLWAASLSCDSCGMECAAACGTRRFRSCCFNYLRRKRGVETVRFFPQPHETDQKLTRLPIFLVENLPEPWLSVSDDFKPHHLEDTAEDRLFVYDK